MYAIGETRFHKVVRQHL